MGILNWFKPKSESSPGYYGRLYDGLIESHEQDGKDYGQALREAVGGDYETYGNIQRDLLLSIGLQPSNSVLDLGCGSGRLARKLAPILNTEGSYLGLDVNAKLLEEADRQVNDASPRGKFRFGQMDRPVMDCEDSSINYLVAFSVATHIDLEDTFSYLRETARVLKPGGKAVFSYLSTEIEDHWRIFLEEANIPVEERWARVRNHVVVPGTLDVLAKRSSLDIVEDVPADKPWIGLSEEITLEWSFPDSWRKSPPRSILLNPHTFRLTVIDTSMGENETYLDPSTGERDPGSVGIGALLLVEGLAMVALSFLLFPKIVSTLLGTDLEPSDRFQLHLMQWGIGWSGLAVMGWGIYEFAVRRQGPLVLLTLLFLLPGLIPFGFFGFGSDHDAWSVAHVAQRMSREGGYLMSRPPGFPLFEGLARVVVPGAGWPGLFVANLCAGIAGCLVWLALPGSISEGKKRLIAILSFGHPLYLLACGTGLDYVWQAALVSASVVFVARAHETRGPNVSWNLVAGAIALGLAAGFRITSLALIPAFLLIPLLCPSPVGKRFLQCLLFLGVTLVVALLCELPVLWNFGLGAIRIHPDHPHPLIILYRLIRYVFPPPLAILLAGGLVALPMGWRKFYAAERSLLGMSLAALAIVLPGFFLLPREPGYLTILVPFVALFSGLTAPRGLHAVCLPALLVWGFLSIPVAQVNPKPTPGLALKPEAGPVVEECMQRFRSMRRSQQVLSMAPKTPTVAIVGFDWTMLAALRPSWEIAEDGGILNPEFPVAYYRWIDPDSFRAMKESGQRILVVELGGHFTRMKYGYDPLAEGAERWNPGMRFYR